MPSRRVWRQLSTRPMVQLQVKGEEKTVKYKLLFTVETSSGICFFRLSCPHQAINYLQLKEISTPFYNWSHKVNRGVFKVRFQLQILNSMINSWRTNICSQTPKTQDEFLSKKSQRFAKASRVRTVQRGDGVVQGKSKDLYHTKARGAS